MKDISFINETLKGYTEEEQEIMRNCDHQLIITAGLPSDIISCKKCGWWSFCNYMSDETKKKYKIIDKRMGGTET